MLAALLRLRPPLLASEDADTDRGPLLAEAVLSALHSCHDLFTLQIASRGGKVGLADRGTEQALPVLRQQLLSIRHSDALYTPGNPAVPCYTARMRTPEVFLREVAEEIERIHDMAPDEATRGRLWLLLERFDAYWRDRREEEEANQRTA